MAFDRNSFIRTALEQDYSYDQINAYLKSKGAKPVGTLEKTLESALIPGIGSAIGAGAGLAIAPLTGGASVPFGAMAGYGGGAVIKNGLLDLLGYQKKGATEQIGEELTNSLGAGAAAETLNLAYPMLRPGQTRANIINNLPAERQSLPATKVQPAIKAPQERYSNPEVIKKSEELGSNLYNKLFPTEGTAQTGIAPKTNVNINDLYKRLNWFQAENKAYESKSPEGLTSKDISNSLRKLINESTPEVKLINKYMSTLEGAKKTAKWWIPATVLGGLGWGLKERIGKLLGGD